jgi:D-alanyl-D-alanine carboxypeptidase/D-alanyl-D-alanine-endopeptidase (penicillin-binding protein 4)
VAPVASLEVNIGKLRDEEYPPRQTDPALSAARVFADALAAQGIAIDGTVARAAAAQGAATIASVDSATVHEVVTYALQTSDNTVTEALGRMVAVKSGFAASFDGATKAVLAHLTAVGLDTSSAQLADCSGLGDGSHLSARLLADILLLATNPAHPEYLPVALDLPVAGMSGTLVDRFTTSGARGVVRAKTGSLPNVTSLAGTILDADGRLLVFAMIADQTPPGGQTEPRVVIDGLVDGLAGCGCLAPSA